MLHDDELMEKAQQGDTVAFGELVKRYQQEIFRLANNILRNPTDAEDVTQDAFLRVFRNRESYEARGQFFFYLRRVVINLSINVLKKRQAPLPPPKEPMSDSEESRLDNKECVLKALSTLDPISQNLLVLREWEGMNYQKISEVMDMTLSNTKVSLHRAREKFRKALLVYFPEEEISEK